MTHESSGAGSARRAIVWLADDSAMERTAIGRALANLYDVEEFDSAPAVLEALQLRRPDVLVLDWHMPDMSGIEACTFVRTTADDAQLPILILTSDADRASLLTAFAAGANDHVRKPFDTAELQSRVETLVRTKRLHDRLLAAEAHLRLEAEHRERFLAILAHDLRQPIHVVSMAAAILADGAIPQPIRKGMAARVGGAAARMDRMIGELLEFARSRSTAGIPLTVTSADLVAITRGIVDEVAGAHGGVVTLVAPAQEPGVWDADRIAQVLSNLLENAIRYRGTEGAVTVTLTSDADTVTVVVTNPGSLAAPEGQLFGAFVRDASSRGGLGLGLYIVRQVALAHGGSVEATSGDGLVHFTVRLPRHTTA